MDLSLTAVLFFALGAPIGAYLAICHFSARERPIPIALMHGGFVATGILCLLWAFLKHQLAGPALVALILFVLAALVGFYLFSRHIRALPLQNAAVLAHAGSALVALFLLALSTL